MSSQDSDLSNDKYQYDFVVATTQASINATMMAFLSSLKEPVVTVCFVADPNSPNPLIIDYTELMNNAHGTDPFAIPAFPPNANVGANPNIKNLLGARFMFGFRARLGLPRMPPSQLPDLVTLGSDTSAVKFNMLCSEFNIVQLTPGSGYYPTTTWLNQSQPPDDPWIFSSRVDLRLSTVGDYSTLPPDIQQKIHNLSSSAFSVQQLLFDLTNAALEKVAPISNIDPGTPLYTMLQTYFLGKYFSEMQSQSQPLLGCSIVMQSAPVSTLSLTDFNFEVCPYTDTDGQPFKNPTQTQQQLATLNYLCAADGHRLPPAVEFDWNWVDASQLNDHDGTVAINRNTFATYFQYQLANMVAGNCILPHCTVTTDGIDVDWSWQLTPGQSPTVTSPPTGQTVLRFDYSGSSSDQAGLNGDMGAMTITVTYSLTVDFIGATIIVTQHQLVYLYLRSLQTAGHGNLVDKQIIDTYTIGIDDQGQLVSSLHSDKTDNSNSPSVNKALDFFTDFNSISQDINDNVASFVGSQLQDMPISTIQDYVFPGGKTFIFKSVQFSDYQDLVSSISYADPTGSPATVASKPYHRVRKAIRK